METKIIEGNKLIAEFMGAKMVVQGYHGINIIKFPDESTKDLHGLKYHSSWDWLMPVVKRCNEISETGKYFALYMFMHNGITNVWDAVVKFIKWYNQQSK